MTLLLVIFLGLQLLVLWLNFPAAELIIHHGLLGLNWFLAILLMLLFKVNRKIFSPWNSVVYFDSVK